MLPDVTNMLSWWQWGIVALIPPAVIALYFLKLKRKPVEVPSTYLWHKSIEDLHVNSLLQRLKNSLLLFLQLLVLLLVLLALLRPSWRGSSLAGERFIFMIDTSASMSADDVQPTRLEQARQQVAQAIDSMPPGSVAMIISFSDSARVEAAFTDNRRELLRRLNLIEPTQKPTDLVEALTVAAGLANPNQWGEAGTADTQVAEALPATLYIYSDGRTPETHGFAIGNLHPVYQMIGKPEVGNVAILAFNTQHNEDQPNKLQAFARVANYGSEPVTFPLSLYVLGSDVATDAAEVTIPAFDPAKNAPGVESRAFNLVDFDSGILELRAEYDDALKVDNRAWATVNPPHPANVLVVTEENEPLLTVLTTGRAKKMASLSVHPPEFLESEDYKKHAMSGTYNLVVFDRCAPKVMPQANTLFIGQVPPVDGWSGDEVLEGPEILDFDRSHPLMNLVEMGDVLIGKMVSKVKTPTGGSVLIDSQRMGPLLAIAPRRGFQDAMLSFWLVDGNRFGTTWWVKPSFPVFVLNVLTYLGGGSDPLSTGLIRPGNTLSLRGQGGGADELEVSTPAGRKVQVRRSNRNTFDFTDTDTTGVYQVAWKDRDPQSFAVNLFDAAESNIVPREELKLGDGEPIQTAEEEVARHEAWKLLLLLGLAVLILEWYIYNRRVAL